jgi:hypothetical protein
MHTLFVTPEKKESIRVTLRFHNVPGLNHSWTSAAAQAGQAFFGKRRKERDKCTAKSRIALWAVAVVIVICATGRALDCSEWRLVNPGLGRWKKNATGTEQGRRAG